MLTSGVGYTRKYGERAHRHLLDEQERFGAADFRRHKMPGTSFPGIHFDSLDRAVTLSDRVVLVADEDTVRQYSEKIGHMTLPASVVSVQVKNNSTEFGRSTLASIAVARTVAETENGKTFVVIGYDTKDRYD